MFSKIKTHYATVLLAFCFIISLIFISQSISPHAQPAQAALDGGGSGLVGWWKFDEGSGTSAGDSSGSGSTGTLINGPAWNTADYKVGSGAMSFDGVDDRVLISTVPTITQPYTASLPNYTTILEAAARHRLHLPTPPHPLSPLAFQPQPFLFPRLTYHGLLLQMIRPLPAIAFIAMVLKSPPREALHIPIPA